MEQQWRGFVEPFVEPFKPKPKLVINDELQPNSGAPGIKVTIKGKNFKPDHALIGTQVFFNRNSADIVSISDTEIVAVVPPGKGNAEVIVDNVGGTSNIASFTYKSPKIYNILPSVGEPKVSVIITGENFGDKLIDVYQSIKFGETLLISDYAISWKDNKIMGLLPNVWVN